MVQPKAIMGSPRGPRLDAFAPGGGPSKCGGAVVGGRRAQWVVTASLVQV